MIKLKILNENPIIDVKTLACTTIGKKASNKKLNETEELIFWKDNFLQEHSTLRGVTFLIQDDNMRGDIASQLLRATKGHPQPEVQSSRPDWNNGEKRKPSNETFINFAHLHTAESWMAMCRQRLCYSTMKETRQKVLDIIEEMRNSDNLFFNMLADFSVPQCVYRMGCCDRRNCNFIDRFIEENKSEKLEDIYWRYNKYYNFTKGK